MTYQSVAGVTAGIVSLLAYAVYARDTLYSNVRPNRATWWIWAVLNWVIVFSYQSAGASWTTLTLYAYAVGATFLGVLSFFRGEGGATRFDLGCLAASIVSIILWIATSSPIPTLMFSLATSAIGAIPTLRKLWRKTGQESVAAYSILAFCSLINLSVALPLENLTLAATMAKITVIIPPAFYVLQCFTLVLLSLRARRAQDAKP